MLVFEDLHWADDGLLDFVDSLVDWATDVPLLVVATARPELLARRPHWGGGKTNAATLSLAPLSEAETTELVHAILERSVLPADVQSAVLARAGGNPLYAEEFARMVAERGDVHDGGDFVLPDSVQGLISARLDLLTRAEKELLQDAAVVGKVFWPGALTANRDAVCALDDAIRGLERKEFVRRDRRSSVEESFNTRSGTSWCGTSHAARSPCDARREARASGRVDRARMCAVKTRRNSLRTTTRTLWSTDARLVAM